MSRRHESGATRAMKPLAAALGMAGAFLALVAWDQSYWWRTKDDYRFGWLVPLFVGYVVFDRWPRIRAAAQACAATRSPGRGANVLAGGALTVGLLLFLLGAWLRAGAGPSPAGTLALTVGAAGATLALIFLNAPRPATPAAPADPGDARRRLTALFVFPALAWLVSAPVLSVVEAKFNLLLLQCLAGLVSFVFNMLGLPVEQQGNVLVLPGGPVGVEDACSGIRSLTGCLFAGSFVAAVFLPSVRRKAALVGTALLLALAANFARGIFLTGWAYRHGPAAIAGPVHDLAGYAVLGLTVAGLLGLLPWFTATARPQPPA